MTALYWTDALAAEAASGWDALLDDDQPFLRLGWLAALERSGALGADSGWQPSPLLDRRDGVLDAAVPAYLKANSYGEYVFDWSWADAYERAGFDYYPKLVVAVPFTPVGGRRFPGVPGRVPVLIDALETRVRHLGLSSAHVLFPRGDEMDALRDAGWLERHGVQFHWRNRGYRDMGDFLDALARDKRKKIRQERRRIAEQGIEVETVCGGAIDEARWQLFYRCYCRTYAEHGANPYLPLSFFRDIGAGLGEQVVLFIARRGEEALAASLCLRDRDTLYGRYWGALVDIPCLHFELCYYQGIDYAITQGLACFEGGAQGEHKLARGFEPVLTHSAHFISDPRFRSAIGAWLQRERGAVASYLADLDEHGIYKITCQGS
ncbi:GNAT family N-acetyltransferase [Paludibacterium yongneupense]|uniref:GNAT family N-acetyltransferase n=1 Tax=Paludibacterium yongneupense TaxID=400061 RepID=UPI00040B1CAD|nr:GNAT family N-acetyltransferase [Paludibacterium yongneupense]